MDCRRAFRPTSELQSPSSPWFNWSGTQEVHAREVVRPSSLEGLQDLLRRATRNKGRARVVATGLSFSDILQADDTLIETTGLMGEGGAVLLPLERELWRNPQYAEPLVRVVCGARIRDLNATLACAGLGFENLGGYDGQTLVGAISTSTHGSGVRIPPLCDGVCGLDLVSTNGKIWRLEPSNGLTCPKKYAERYGTTRELLQSDAEFWSAVVSLGCMGVVYSVTFKVRSAYRLRERRTLRKWQEVRAELARAPSPLDRTRNYELAINPYRRPREDFTCLVTERWLAEPNTPSIPLPQGRQKAEVVIFLESTQTTVQALMNGEPQLIPGILELGLEQLETQVDHVDDSFIIYNIGKINTADVVSGEYFFPMHNGAHWAGIQGILEAIEHNWRAGIHQSTPVAVRFVKQSQAPLSMAQAVPHATVEMSLWRHQPRACEALLSYERVCLANDGRPHWGEMNLLTGGKGWLGSAYPRLGTWLAAYKRFNDQHVFDNHFTDRVLKGALG